MFPYILSNEKKHTDCVSIEDKYLKVGSFYFANSKMTDKKDTYAVPFYAVIIYIVLLLIMSFVSTTFLIHPPTKVKEKIETLLAALDTEINNLAYVKGTVGEQNEKMTQARNELTDYANDIKAEFELIDKCLYDVDVCNDKLFPAYMNTTLGCGADVKNKNNVCEADNNQNSVIGVFWTMVALNLGGGIATYFLKR